MKSYQDWRDEAQQEQNEFTAKAFHKVFRQQEGETQTFVIPRDAEAIKASFKAKRQQHYARKFWKNAQ